MKVDLEDLKRRALEQPEDEWFANGPHNSPAVTLALIARIRELESDAEAIGLALQSLTRQLLSTAAKGTVLP